MTALAELVEVGKAMGLEGKELRCWIDETEKARIEAEKARIEAEKEKARAEREERQAERDLKKAEAEMEKARIEAEMEKARIELETRKLDGGKIDNTYIDPFKNAMKLPFYTEGVDNMDTYLARFELRATSVGVPKDKWAGYVIGLMRGKALDICQRMSHGELSDYEMVKDALLRLCGNTAEGYREKFHHIRPIQNEDPQLFTNNVCIYFDRWVALSEVNPTYEDLKEFIIVDKAVNACHKDVTAFLKERGPKKIKEVTELLRKYKAAHPDKQITPSRERERNGTDQAGPQGNAHEPNTAVATVSDRSRSRTPKISQSSDRSQSPYRPHSQHRSPSPLRQQSPYRHKPQSPHKPQSHFRQSSPHRSQSQKEQSYTYRYEDSYKQKHQTHDNQNKNRQLHKCYTCGKKRTLVRRLSTK